MPSRKPTLTRRQQEIYEFLCEHAHGFAHPPTLDELASTLGLKSRGSLHKQIQALIDAGLVEPMNRTRRGIRLTAGPHESEPTNTPDNALPMLGRIAAGRPIQAMEDDQRIDVPANLRSGDHCFVLQVQGDSMIEDGIFDGDWIVVEPCQQAGNGEMVVAMVDGSEATVKRLLQRPGEVVLIPANSTMAPIHLAPDRVQIQGVVVGQMRSYR